MSARHRTLEGGWIPLNWKVRSVSEGVVALGSPARLSADAGEPWHFAAPSDGTARASTLEAMALVVEAKNPGLRCSILLVDEEGDHVTVGAGPSLPPEYNSAVEGLQIGPAVGSCGTAAFWNVPVVVEDISEDPLRKGLREAAALAGVLACWSHPISARDGRVLGAMALYANMPSAPTPRQMEGLEIAARMVGLAIERDQLEERLQQAAKLEAVGRLAGGIAHDFNNLLTVILGHVEVMDQELDVTPDPAVLKEIRHAIERASEITSQLLAFGREQVRCPERVVLSQVVLDVMRVLDPLIGDQISVSVEADPSVDAITVDPTQLRQAVLNLVLNAMEAMPDGGKLTVAVRHAYEDEISSVVPGCASGSFVAVAVTDIGTGMDRCTLARVFEPFFSTKEAGRGAGLGLSTVHGLIRQNGGYVLVRSGPGSGSTFTVLLPKSEGRAELKDDRSNATGTETVLVVEDFDPIRDLIVRVLAQESFRVVQARNGVDALGLIEGGLVPDLIVTDVTMPVMGGVDLVARARQLHPHLAVLYVSGHPKDRIGASNKGLEKEAFLAKPFTPAQLRQAVDRVRSRDSLN